MARLLQLYASFAIKNNRVNFHSDRYFPIDSILTDNDQELAMLSGM